MKTSKITTVSQFLFLTILFLLPVLFLPLNIVALEPLKVYMLLATGVVLGVTLLVQKIKKNSFFVSKNLLWISVGAILLSTLLSSLFSNNIGISLFGSQVSLQSFVGIFLLFSLSYSVASLFDDISSRARFFLTLHVSLILVIVLQLINVFVPFVPSLGFFVNNTINTVGRWYDFGLVSLFTLLSSVLVLQFLRHSQFYATLGWIGFVLSAVALVLVNSTLVWVLAGLFALLFIVLNAVIQHDALAPHRMSYPALGVLVASILFALIGGKIAVLTNSFFSLQFEEVRPTLTSTIEVVGDTLREDPAFGVGLNRFETSWLKNRPDGVNLSNYWDTDFKYGYSNLLSVPVTQGILGIVTWLLFIGVSLYYAFKLLFVPLEQKSDLFVHLYSVLGLVFFLVALLVYVPSVVVIGLFFVFFGLFVSNLNSAGLIRYKEIKIDKSPRVSFAYILSLVVVLVVFVYAGFIVTSQYVSRVIFDNASRAYAQDGNVSEFENGVLKAQFVYASDAYFKSLAEIGMTKMGAIIQNTSISQESAAEQFRGVLQQTVQYAQAAISYDPMSYRNRMALVALYKNLVQIGVSGAQDEAIKILDDTSTLTPNNPSLHIEKARVFAIAKQYDAAISEIEQAIRLKPNYVDAAFLLSQIKVSQGKTDEAVASIQAALAVAPYDSNLHFQLGLLRYNQGKYNDAVASLERAVMISPYFANAKYFLGLSYYQNGRTADAITQFGNLSQVYPDNQEVSLILSNLKSGKTPFDGAQSPITSEPEKREGLPVDDKNPQAGDSEKAES